MGRYEVPRITSDLTLDPQIYGATEQTLFGNAEYHAIKAHDYTEESWQEELSKNLEHFRKLIKMS